MEKYYILEDEGSYYVSEDRSSMSFKDAKRINSLEELITTIPIMKDWNWDYKVVEVSSDGVKTPINDNVWWDMHREWKGKNPEAYKKLYGLSKEDSM